MWEHSQDYAPRPPHNASAEGMNEGGQSPLLSRQRSSPSSFVKPWFIAIRHCSWGLEGGR